MNRAREGYKNDKKWGKCKKYFCFVFNKYQNVTYVSTSIF